MSFEYLLANSILYSLNSTPLCNHLPLTFNSIAGRWFWFRLLAYHPVCKQRTVVVHTSSCAPDMYSLKSPNSTYFIQIRCWHAAIFLLNTEHGIQASNVLQCWLYISHMKTNCTWFQDEVWQYGLKALKCFEQFNSNGKLTSCQWFLMWSPMTGAAL